MLGPNQRGRSQGTAAIERLLDESGVGLAGERLSVAHTTVLTALRSRGIPPETATDARAPRQVVLDDPHR